MELTSGALKLVNLKEAAGYMEENLRERIWKLDVMHTHSLYSTLEAKDVQDTIRLLYDYYGMFVDMGVGKHVPLNKVGQLNRKQKKWYSKTIYREVARLADYVAKQTGLRMSEVTAKVAESGKSGSIFL